MTRLNLTFNGLLLLAGTARPRKGFDQDDLQEVEVEMAWIYLLIAGVLEVAWATGLKKLGISFSWALGILTIIAMIASLVALYAAMIRIPLGIAYPIWTGIGSVGSVVLGMTVFGQNLSPVNIMGLIFLVAGMFLLASDAH